MEAEATSEDGEEEGSTTGMGAGIVAGAAVGGAIVLALVIGGVAMMRRRRSPRRRKTIVHVHPNTSYISTDMPAVSIRKTSSAVSSATPPGIYATPIMAPDVGSILRGAPGSVSVSSLTAANSSPALLLAALRGPRPVTPPRRARPRQGPPVTPRPSRDRQDAGTLTAEDNRVQTCWESTELPSVAAGMYISEAGVGEEGWDAGDAGSQA